MENKYIRAGRLRKYRQGMLPLLFLLELAMLTYWKNILGYYASPLLLFLISVAIGILPLLIFYNVQFEKNILNFKTDRITYSALGLSTVVFISLFFLIRGGLFNIFSSFPVTVHSSDIIPTVEVMCKRFLSGQTLYTNIEDFGYYLPTTYLPFQWLPYLPAEYFHFDYRWITVGIWFASVIILILFLVRKNHKYYAFFVALMPMFLLAAYIDKNTDVLGWTIEFMTAGFYALLAISFFSNSVFFRAMMIVICLLSRYSFAVYLPLYGLLYLYAEKPLKGFRLAGLSALLLAMILIPLVGKNWGELYEGFRYYSMSGLGEWKHFNEAGMPFHLFNGNGFASWFYTSDADKLQSRFNLLREVHIFSLLGITTLLGIIYTRIRRKMDYRIFLLCGLKIYFAFFYGFIQVPYLYLFVVPLMWSVCILMFTAYLSGLKPANTV